MEAAGRNRFSRFPGQVRFPAALRRGDACDPHRFPLPRITRFGNPSAHPRGT